MAKHESTTRLTREQRIQKMMLCDGLNFAAAEAYKLLRTNLRFSMPEKDCHIVGVTSSVRSEGKSTTAINLAYTLAQSGKRVLLIDADMRLPSVAGKLNIAGKPGLSNLLAGLNDEQSCLRGSGYFDNWVILPAGDIPPNPSELLGSQRMHSLIEHYEKYFDNIILDLPPVGVVTDALTITEWTDGLILVVRQNYTERRALNDCMYQLKNYGNKFLGFVMTDAAVGEGSYKHYSKYGKKYGYGYGYGYGYENAGKSVGGRKEKAFMSAAKDWESKPDEAGSAADAEGAGEDAEASEKAGTE